jgi:hypothetical protein
MQATGAAHVVEHLPSKCEALCSTSRTAKKKKKRRRKEKHLYSERGKMSSGSRYVEFKVNADCLLKTSFFS